MPEIRKVPVPRLARNIERRLAENPGDITLRLSLARVYAMAYALKVSDLDARTERGKVDPFFGFQVPSLPGRVRPPRSPREQERAKADLAKALAAYADVIARAPDNAIGRIGHAWVLEQSGERSRATEEYRKAVELAWPADRRQEAFWVDPVTAEAAGRLLDLLDPVRDAAEIAALREKQAELATKGRLITPIAIPLGAGDGPPVDLRARVLFDADGSGILRRWTWTQPDAAWLVYDADGSGRITSALQWFGNATFWLFWTSGYEALTAGQPLSSHGIVALSCAFEPGNGSTIAAYSPRGVTFATSRTRPTYDVLLKAAGASSITTPPAGN